MNRRRNYAQMNSISYGELKLMDENKCVKVSISYLYLLTAKIISLNLTDENLLEILKKYVDIIGMQEFVGEKIYSYCLMTVNDLLFLISTLNKIPSGRILKWNNSCTFEEYYEHLKQSYVDKILKINLEKTDLNNKIDNNLKRIRIQ